MLKKSGNFVFTDGVCTTLTKNDGFHKGDELFCQFNGDFGIYWVVESEVNYIKLMSKSGNLPTNTLISLKMLRSGRRNQQNTPMQVITLKTNPLTNIQNNIYQEILQASAIEYTEDWRTFCECFLNPDNPNFTSNEYVKGTKGVWRPKANFVHLTNRSQTYENKNYPKTLRQFYKSRLNNLCDRNYHTVIPNRKQIQISF